jgi:hypothetical protein
VDAHGVQAFYTGLIARESDMDVSAQVTPEFIEISARSLGGVAAGAVE